MSEFNKSPTTSPGGIVADQSPGEKGPEGDYATNQGLRKDRGTLLDPRFGQAIDLLRECEEGNGDPFKIMEAMCLFAQSYRDAAIKHKDEEGYQLTTLGLQELIKLGNICVQVFCFEEIIRLYSEENIKDREKRITNYIKIARQADELEKMRLLALRPLNL